MTGQAPHPELHPEPHPEEHPRHTQPQRIDGWTPERQRGFLERIAEGATVDEATASVGLSPRAAYALRRRATGAAFALGWDAAKLVARPIVAEALFLRAIAGQVERITKPDGDVIERHRYDNRLAMALLARLDRHAEDSETTSAAARMIATEFDAFLDLVERDAGPARAGLFLGERLQSNAGPGAGAGEAAMAPILALARADRWLRSGGGLSSEVAVGDLDPAARATWTAEQWARAEAAGLLQLAPEPAPKPAEPARADPAPASALPALRSQNDHIKGQEDREDDSPVWRDTVNDVWRTCFPPPRDYFGTEIGVFGEEEYSRECSDEEAIILDAPHDREVAARIVVESGDRDAWFVGYAVDGGLVDDDAAAAAGEDDATRVAVLARAFDPLRQPHACESSSHDAVVPPPKAGGAAPNCPTGRSPRVISFDGVPHEHLQQDQVRHLR